MSYERPYEGLRVLDVSQGFAGPYAAGLLSLYGASVTKVEPPAGDWIRGIGTSFDGHTALGAVANRGKRSIALDLKTDEGREIAHKLSAEADVMLENFRPGVMARFGLDYTSVQARNPNLVYMSLTGFGQDGPNSSRPATDMVLQAFSGLMTINRDPSGKPQRINMVAIDVISGLYAFQAVSAALYKKALQGKGSHIEMSLMEAAAALQSGPIMEHQLGVGRAEGIGVPIGTFRTRDGFININARRDATFARFCTLMGREELIADPRFVTPRARIDNEAAILAIIEEETVKRTTADWDRGLTEIDILHAPVNDHAAYLADEHVKGAGVVSYIEHDTVGTMPMPKIPGIDALKPGDALAHAPHIGEHTADILRGLGYGEDRIERLAAEKVIGQYDPDAAPANAGVAAP